MLAEDSASGSSPAAPRLHLHGHAFEVPPDEGADEIAFGAAVGDTDGPSDDENAHAVPEL